jgi:hypothetical protein
MGMQQLGLAMALRTASGVADERVCFTPDDLAAIRAWFDAHAAVSPWAGFSTLGGHIAVALFSRDAADGCMMLVRYADGSYAMTLRGGRVLARERALGKLLAYLAPAVTCH